LVLVMLAAVTLLPAMLGFAGRAIDKIHVPGLVQSGPRPRRELLTAGARTVQRHPAITGPRRCWCC